MTLHLFSTSTPRSCLFVPLSFYLILNELESMENIKNNFFFLSIVWWLSEEVGFSYWVASWNKFIIAEWRFV